MKNDFFFFFLSKRLVLTVDIGMHMPKSPIWTDNSNINH